MSMNPSSNKRRSYVRISVRALMVLVLFAGGWMGWLVRSARVQRAAVAAIQRVNGYVEYEWDFTNPNRKPSPRSWWPKWLVDSLGVEYFFNIVAVDLDDRATDLELVHVGNLTRLRSLQLSQSEVTDSGLAYLQGLTSLKRLTLKFTGVTDAGLAHLKGLTSLEEIRLQATGCSDAGLAHLSALPHLKILGLANTRVTAAGLARLKAASRLEQVIISGTRVTDDDLAHLEGLKSLRLLGLGNAPVSEQVVDRLRKALPNLTIRRASSSGRVTIPAMNSQTAVESPQ
jgi:internalin A